MAKRYAVCKLCDHAHSSREPHVLIGGPEPSKAVRELAAMVASTPERATRGSIDSVTVATGPMSRHDAIVLTEQIRRTQNDWCRLVYEAHEREAWRAMGYPTWGAYVEAELPINRSRSYQLLKRARVALAAGLDLSTTVDIPPERQIRAVSEEGRERITKAVAVSPEAGRNQLAVEVKRALPPKATKRTRDPATGAACAHEPLTVVICKNCGKRLE